MGLGIGMADITPAYCSFIVSLSPPSRGAVSSAVNPALDALPVAHTLCSKLPPSPPTSCLKAGLVQGFQLHLETKHRPPKSTISSHRLLSPRSSQGTANTPSKFVGKATQVKRTSSPCQSGRQPRLRHHLVESQHAPCRSLRRQWLPHPRRPRNPRFPMRSSTI